MAAAAADPTPLASAVISALGHHLDDDAREYVTSLLSEDPSDPDAREAVTALVGGSVGCEAAGDAACAELFGLLDGGDAGGGGGGGVGDGGAAPAPAAGGGGVAAGDAAAARDAPPPMRRLEQSVTLKTQDVTTFAMGLSAEDAGSGGGGPAPPPSSSDDARAQSRIAGFYANMIDASDSPAATSERSRRKARQRALRERMEEEERERAIRDAMDMMGGEGDGGGGEEGGGGGGEGGGGDGEGGGVEGSAASDNASDVRMRDLDLPNLRGGGPDLLSGASLTLSRGRRYGLMGRNGCGKTTLMSCIAARKVPGGVPRNMSMLLVRQEIAGNECTAAETVLKSDVRREGVKKFIGWCEAEMERLERGEVDAPAATACGEESKKSEDKAERKPRGGAKGRQKLRDRKKQSLQKKRSNVSSASASSSASNGKGVESSEARLSRLADRLSDAHRRLALIEEAEGGDPEPRARRVLSGLGFTPDMQDKPTRELSGGWRMRVSLACALFADPDLLLLDEPTNHLDLEAVLWLERYLTTKFRGTLVVVSHDRHFLDEVVTDVVHFHRSKLTSYRGDVTNFEAVRVEERARRRRLFEAQEAKRQHLQKYIDLHAQAGENGVKAARQRKSRMKKLDKLGVMAQEGRRYRASYDGDAEEVEEVEEDDEVVLNFPDPGGFDGDIVRLEMATFGYSPDDILLREVDLSVDLKSRAALLGRNGCGKSTLIKLAVGALRPLGGKSAADGRARIEYLAQHQLEQLDPDGTPLGSMAERYPGDMSNSHLGELRRYLANFGLGGEVLPNQRIRTMSGGQKCRLCLALAMYRRPHLLVLDEPTNHLDLETTAALIDAINRFRGGVLLVSHDQHLITSVCRNLYVVEGGRVEELRGGTTNAEAFEAYKKAVVQGRR